MTDTKRLEELTKCYKKSYLAEMLGITRAGYYNKANGKTQFNQSEIKQLSKLLHLTSKQMCDIFFADEVDETSR